MPFAGYETWDDCVIAQMKKGKTKKEAEKICGFLEKKSKGKE